MTAAQVAGDAPLEQGGGGWSWILSDLKTLLETGKSHERLSLRRRRPRRRGVPASGPMCHDARHEALSFRG